MTPHLADTPVLTTERLTLRAPRFEDYPVWEAFFLSDRSEFIGAWPDPTRGRAWRAFAHIAGMWALRGFGSFVFTRKGSDAAIGSVGPWTPVDWPENELGWTVWTAEDEGRGLACEAVVAARRFAYGALGWRTAVSYIDRANARSVALAKRLGCILDEEAATPDGDGATLVYRHPAPEALA